MEENKLPNSNEEHPISDNNKLSDDVQSSQSKDFSDELKSENNNLDAEKFAQKQMQYKQILDANAVDIDTNSYIWRIGFGRRVGAYLLDNVFLILLMIVIATLTGIADEMIDYVSDAGSWATSPQKLTEFTDLINTKMLPLSLAVTFVYFSLEVIFAQSLGKMLLGIIIGDADKKFAVYPKLILRCAIKNVSSVLSLIFLITSLGFMDTLASICGFIVWIGCFFVLSDKKQAFHDTITKTAVYFKDELQQLNAKSQS